MTDVYNSRFITGMLFICPSAYSKTHFNLNLSLCPKVDYPEPDAVIFNIAINLQSRLYI